MTPLEPERDDELLAGLIASAADNGAAPDAAFLERLRIQSTEAFLAAGSPPAPNSRKARPAMMTFLRFSAFATAAAVLIAVAMNMLPTSSQAAPLQQVLDQVADADSLHLYVSRAGRAGEAWVVKGGKLRWDTAAGRYEIAHGKTVYRIDEASNRFTRSEPGYFPDDKSGLDVFAVLGLKAPPREMMVDFRPTERGEREGVAVNIYKMGTESTEGEAMAVEIETDAATGKLRQIQVFAQRAGFDQLIAALTVLAQGKPVPEEKFAVASTLSEDGRVGKIVDVQGIVCLKPVLGERWTPIRPNVVLKPGDWVRSDIRGANAATLKLLSQSRIIVGPGGLLEVVKPAQVRLHEGEAEIAPSKDAPIEVLGPGNTKLVVKERKFFRIENEQVVEVPKEPMWLKGFKGATANESLGSLVAKVDGRNVNLSVGYHKVTVDIRDQIARTTIEESFVNHTPGQLEGVFHFPLPQDASISGFGMWIGDQLVEADVVEKQRAREIYEEIMRERRDPGLLEWTGGNIFKARVWPIFGHSEKRIKITYTQVLPLKGGKYRYSYALQSEMLQANPLRELAIDVKLSSEVPLKSVTCPTHTVRADKADKSAHLEFSAQEHTPTKDFEVVVEVADKTPEVVVIPHRRGDDGYFLMQVTPPAPAAADRELVADGNALNLILVCDTSASMGPTERMTQASTAAAMLEALTPKDTFNLACADVTAEWAFDKPQPATPQNIGKARTFLAGRVSLGWTNLDNAFEAALKQCGAKGQVVYLGDGIVTNGDADPQAFSERLTKLYKAAGTNATFHAVAVGSAFEPGVMKTIGSLGAGSMRRVSSEQGPVAVALELLGEMTRPPVRDLKVQFAGWKTAKVYPEVLPNLVPGTQQIIIGRYLPEGKDQQGDVTVSGMRDGKELKYSAKVVLKDAESGNSFIPRLWARMHLEKLLEQPRTETIKDDIIALSEEYNIITPYTSFLVLESDADRERFQVKRRFQMRDGEKFFAEGRDNAVFELARQQMKRAGDWRVGLRRSVLARFAELGRNAHMFENRDMTRIYQRGGEVPTSATYTSRVKGEETYLDVFGRPQGMAEEDELANKDIGYDRDAESKSRITDSKNEPGEPGASSSSPAKQPGTTDAPGQDDAIEALEKATEGDGKEGGKADKYLADDLDFAEGGKLRKKLSSRTEQFMDYERADGIRGFGGFQGGGFGYGNYAGDYRYGGGGPGRGLYPPQHQRWFDGLFGTVPAAAVPAKAKKSNWPKEASDLANSLLRRDTLAKLQGGIRIERQTRSFDVRTGNDNGVERRLEIYSPKSWATRTDYTLGQSYIEWCDGKERGTWGTGFQLGRIRAALPADTSEPVLRLDDWLVMSIEMSYHHMKATVEKADGKTVLLLKHPTSDYETRYTIDNEKHVVLTIEQFAQGKRTWTNTYGDFKEIAGAWWPQRHESTDAEGRKTALITSKIEALTADEFQTQVKETTAGRDSVLFLRSPEVSVSAAKKAVDAKKAGIDEQFALLNHFAGYQQWAKANEHLDAFEKLTADKPGARWVRTVYLQANRRGEELRKRLLDEADRLEKTTAGEALMLADFIYGQASSVIAPNELLELLDKIRPVYERAPKHTQTLKRWQQNRLYALQNSGRNEDAFALQKQMAEAYSLDYNVQYNYVYMLFNRGDHDGAYAHIKKSLDPKNPFAPWEAEQLRLIYVNFLEGQGRLTDSVKYLDEWLKANPENHSANQRYLSVLVRSGEREKAFALAEQWLRESRVEGEMPPVVQARYYAAASLLVGRGHALYNDRIEARFLPSLAETARFFALHSKHYQLADTILHQPHFNQTDEGRKLRRELLDLVTRQVAELPAPRLTHLVNLMNYYPPEADKAVWEKLANGLRARWLVSDDPAYKHQLGYQIAQLLAGRMGPDEYLAFLRLQWEQGPEAYRADYTSRLFEALVASPWTEAREAEALALLPKLGDADLADAQLQMHLSSLLRLTDVMVRARNDSLRKDIEKPETLTRIELMKKHGEALKKAREGYAARLAKVEAELPAAIRKWAKLERLYLLTLTDADPKTIVAECWGLLGDAPKPRTPADDLTLTKLLEESLHDRVLAMVMHFAARKNAGPELVARTLKYIDAGIAAEPTERGWKNARFQMLVALDKPKDLEESLTAWIKAGDVEGRWRTALGYLLAEQGRIKEAIALFEAVEKADELSYSHYRALAGWYMAVNQREAHDKAIIRSYKMVDENSLSRMIYARLRPWQGGGAHLPTELDKEVLHILAALFEKSSYPQNYLHTLHQFYAACRDFRLLAVMCDAVIGQSAGKVYPFLQGMRTVLGELRDEAAADEILAHIEKLRATAKTPIDLRALDLLEMQVRRRAAELLNQPGPHAEKALAAMKRAFDRPWADGEISMMSTLLRDLGAITRKELAAEQIREMRALHELGKAGSSERMHLAHNLGMCLGYYSRYEDALAVLYPALTEYEKAHDNVMPLDANGMVGNMVTFHENLKQHAKAEQLLQRLALKPANAQQGLYLTMLLNDLYHRTLGAGGEVSLGSGRQLYVALEKKLLKEVETNDQNHRYGLLNLICSVYRTAKDKNIPNVLDDLKAFAHKTLPPILKKQNTNYTAIVGNVGRTLHDLVNPVEGVQFLVDRIEDEPEWFHLNNQDGWSQHSWTLAHWRTEAPNLGQQLEDRLLKLVLTELRKDLMTQRQRSRAMYQANHTYYWSQKENDFVKVAEEVYAERKKSGPAVVYIADYFYNGCHRPARAIDIMYAALEEKKLEENNVVTLVNYLQGQNRYDESIKLIVPFVAKYPDNLQYRHLLFAAYYQTGKRVELVNAFADAEKHFRDKTRWNEPTMSSLGEASVNYGLPERAVLIYGELIPLHQRTHPGRGVGNGTLSHYYQRLATAHSSLGQTMEAIDAASGAIVAWGSYIQNRADALNTLRNVLSAAKDLDKVVEAIDAQTAESGLINPILRKAIGQTYHASGKYPQAIAQFQISMEAQPNDAETLTALIDCFDKMKNPEGAIVQVLRALELSRRDIKRYENLAQRYEGVGKSAEAERAYTSIVEMLPNESEGHALLAEIRQRQNRWADAIVHWEQVAKIRALEPNGLMGLAAAQLHEKQYEKAGETIGKLKARAWPAFFSDAPNRIADLERQLRDAKKQ